MTDIVSAAKGLVTAAMATAIMLPDLPDHVVLAAISGLAGGVCRTFAEREKLWPKGLGTIIMGIMAAVFLLPIADPLMKPLIGPLELGALENVMLNGFITGLTGVTIIGLVVDFMNAKRGDKDE